MFKKIIFLSFFSSLILLNACIGKMVNQAMDLNYRLQGNILAVPPTAEINYNVNYFLSDIKNSTTNYYGDYEITGYSWDFDCDGIAELYTTLPRTNFSFAKKGVYSSCVKIDYKLIGIVNYKGTSIVKALKPLKIIARVDKLIISSTKNAVTAGLLNSENPINITALDEFSVPVEEASLEISTIDGAKIFIKDSLEFKEATNFQTDKNGNLEIYLEAKKNIIEDESLIEDNNIFIKTYSSKPLNVEFNLKLVPGEISNIQPISLGFEFLDADTTQDNFGNIKFKLLDKFQNPVSDQNASIKLRSPSRGNSNKAWLIKAEGHNEKTELVLKSNAEKDVLKLGSFNFTVNIKNDKKKGEAIILLETENNIEYALNIGIKNGLPAKIYACCGSSCSNDPDDCSIELDPADPNSIIDGPGFKVKIEDAQGNLLVNTPVYVKLVSGYGEPLEAFVCETCILNQDLNYYGPSLFKKQNISDYNVYFYSNRNNEETNEKISPYVTEEEGVIIIDEFIAGKLSSDYNNLYGLRVSYKLYPDLENANSYVDFSNIKVNASVASNIRFDGLSLALSDLDLTKDGLQWDKDKVNTNDIKVEVVDVFGNIVTNPNYDVYISMVTYNSDENNQISPLIGNFYVGETLSNLVEPYYKNTTNGVSDFSDTKYGEGSFSDYPQVNKLFVYAYIGGEEKKLFEEIEIRPTDVLGDIILSSIDANPNTSSIDFGTQNYGVLKTSTIKIKNSGTVSIGNITASAANSTFSVKENLCTSLSYNQECTIVFEFLSSDTALGQNNSFLNISGIRLDSYISVLNIPVSGYRNTAAKLVETNNLSFYDFGKVSSENSCTEFTIGNDGETPAGLTNNLNFTLEDASNFSIEVTDNDCSQASFKTLDASRTETCKIKVCFSDNLNGIFSTVLKINAELGGSLDINLSGERGSVASLEIVPTLASFINTFIGDTLELTLSLKNTGDFDAVINPNTTNNSFSNNVFKFKNNSFTLSGDCPLTITKNSPACNFTVIFSPTEEKTYNDNFKIFFNNSLNDTNKAISLSGTGLSRRALLSMSGAHNFNNLNVGSSGEYLLTLNNTGTRGTASISYPEDSGEFIYDEADARSTCNVVSVLGVGSSCVMVLKYSPVNVGTDVTTFTVTYNNGVDAGQTLNIALSGTGTSGVVYTATSLSYGSNGCSSGTGSSLTCNAGDCSFNFNSVCADTVASITIKNTGTTNSISNLSLNNETGSSKLTNNINTCSGKSLLKNESCIVKVTLSYANGANLITDIEASSFSISDGLGLSTLNFNISGHRKVQGNLARVSIDDDDATTSIAYGTINYGVDVTKKLLLKNVGEVMIGSFSVADNPNRASYIIESETCSSGNLGYNETCQVLLKYTTIDAELGVMPETNLVISGTGENSSVENLSVAISGSRSTDALLVEADGDSFHDFGIVGTGSSTCYEFNIKNTGETESSVLGISITGTDASAYSIGTASINDCQSAPSNQLTGGSAETCNVSVCFSGTSVGNMDDASLVIDATRGGTLNFALDGFKGTASSLMISAVTTSDFGTVYIGESGFLEFNVENQGDFAASIDTINTESALSGMFSYKGGSYPGTGGNCESTLQSGASCKLVVAFTPAGETFYAENIDVFYNNGTINTSRAIAIEGTGEYKRALLSLSKVSYDFGNVFVGESGTVNVTLSNIGLTTASDIVFPTTVGEFTYDSTNLNNTCDNLTPSDELGASTTCVMVFKYGATNFGSDEEDLTITYNNIKEAGQLKSITLIGNGINGVTYQAVSVTYNYETGGTSYTGGTAFNCSPADTCNFSFGDVKDNIIATITIKNVGTVDATTALTISGTAAYYIYQSVASTCNGNTLTKNETCTIKIKYTYNSASTSVGLNDSLSLSVTDGLSAYTLNFTIGGHRQVPADLVLLSVSGETSATNIDFGTRDYNQNYNRTATIKNIGETELLLNSVNILENLLSYTKQSLSIVSNDCLNANLSYNEPCDIALKFETIDSELGILNNIKLSILGEWTNKTGDTQDTLLLDILGRRLIDADLEEKTNTLTYNFETLYDSSQPCKIFVIENRGETEAGKNSVGIAASITGTTEFVRALAASDDCSDATSLAGSSATTCNIKACFNGTTVGSTFNGILGVTSNRGTTALINGTTKPLNISLSGARYTPANLSISADTTNDFGTVFVGVTSSSLKFTVTNSGQSTATINTSGSNDLLNDVFDYTGTGFPGTGGNCGNILATGETCKLDVMYKPTIEGIASADIQVLYNNNLVGTTASLSITGNGLAKNANLVLKNGYNTLNNFNFSLTKINYGAKKVFTLENIGNYTASNIVYPSTIGDFSYLSTHSLNTCDGVTSLEPGEACDVILYYNPLSKGVDGPSNLSFAYKQDTTNKTLLFPLSGEGVDFSEYINFTRVASGKAESLDVNNDYVFVAHNGAGLKRFNRNSLTDAPTTLYGGYYVNDVSSGASSIYISGGMLGSNSTAVISINPFSELNRLVSASGCVSSFAKGNYVFIGCNTLLKVMNLSTYLIEDGVALANYAWDVFIDGNYGYLATVTNGLARLAVNDVQNLGSPSYYNTGGDTRSVFVDGNYLYLGLYGNVSYPDLDKGFKIFNKNNLSALGFYSLSSGVEKIVIEGTYLYASSGTSISVFDVSDPTSISEVANINTGDGVNEIKVLDSKIYVANSTSGLLVISK